MHTEGFSIENGYLVLTLMPSLYCPYNCSHCYLSTEQRRDKYIMPIDQLKSMLVKIDDYYSNLELTEKNIVVYYYGGEPLSMGLDYFEAMIDAFKTAMPASKGYKVKHLILSSLLGEDLNIWESFIKKHCEGYIQTSFDGLMRGKGYLRRWEEKVKEARSRGLNLGTISVLNQELLKVGAKETLDYLSDLGIMETGWLPFMENIQNKGDKYNKFAPTMTAFNDFMISLYDHSLDRKRKGLTTPMIGEAMFIANNFNKKGLNNLAIQTLFVMPNGDVCLPDYRDGYTEYMNIFGNLVTMSFADVLTSKERQIYLRKQFMRNNNVECLDCELSNACLLEFAKPSRSNDECFGAKRFVEHVVTSPESIKLVSRGHVFA